MVKETEENQSERQKKSQESAVSWKPMVARILLNCAKEGRLG